MKLHRLVCIHWAKICDGSTYCYLDKSLLNFSFFYKLWRRLSSIAYICSASQGCPLTRALTVFFSFSYPVIIMIVVYTKLKKLCHVKRTNQEWHDLLDTEVWIFLLNATLQHLNFIFFLGISKQSQDIKQVSLVTYILSVFHIKLFLLSFNDYYGHLLIALYGSRKYPYPPQGRPLEFRDGGGPKSQNFES